MNRREFLTGSAAAAAFNGSHSAEAAVSSMPVIDTHIHLFDINRPQGVPWPPKDNAILYKTALPSRYRKLAEPHGIVGAIEVECSPWLEDNQWVLDVMAKEDIMVGTIGDLEPEKPGFARDLERFHKNPLFLGIRYGNLWGRDFHTQVSRPAFIAGVRRLADAGLTLDTANPNPLLTADLLRLTNAVPGLRLVIDHLPQLDPPTGAAARKTYEAGLAELGQNPNVFVKISEVLRRVGGRVPLDVAFYKERLDHLFGVFGEDRVLYGSDWPNSDNWAPYGEVFRVAHAYFTAKGTAIAEKYFWRNSIRAYRWKPRNARQPRG